MLSPPSCSISEVVAEMFFIETVSSIAKHIRFVILNAREVKSDRVRNSFDVNLKYACCVIFASLIVGKPGSVYAKQISSVIALSRTRLILLGGL
ncbi:hypothetical protein D3C85_1342540 [compost metagenome]